MNEATAQLNSYRQSPRKVRVVANAIRGKSVEEAKNRLNFIVKKAVSPLHKLLNSAVANAKNLGLDSKVLMVKSVTVDGGSILYRRRPAWHGMAHPIHKRTSHIKIVLSELKDSKIKRLKDSKKKTT